MAHREIVTNREVPNLTKKERVGNRMFCKRLIIILLQNGRCRTSERGGDRQTKKPAERLACCVDYYDKLSNFLEDLLKLDRLAESVYDDLGKDGNPELE